MQFESRGGGLCEKVIICPFNVATHTPRKGQDGKKLKKARKTCERGRKGFGEKGRSRRA